MELDYKIVAEYNFSEVSTRKEAIAKFFATSDYNKNNQYIAIRTINNIIVIEVLETF